MKKNLHSFSNSIKTLLPFICFFVSSSSHALVGDHFWVGGLIGTQTFKIGGSVTPPLNYGGSVGVKFGSVGLGAFYFTGTRTTSQDPLTLDVKLAATGGQLDFFLAGKIIYLGPRVASFTNSATFSGGTASNRGVDSSISGIIYGGGGGINIPLGLFMTFGADINYLVGAVGGYGSSLTSIMGSLKFWL